MNRWFQQESGIIISIMELNSDMNKMHLVFAAWVFVLMISCNGSEDTGSGIVTDTVTTNENTATAETRSLSGCYSMIQGKDTATLNINVSDSNVSGKLRYKLFEKDQNDGIINGVLKDDRIVAKYTFQSEGMSSVREVVFSIKNDSLLEGYGETVVKNDTARFVNTTELAFMKNPFIKVACSDK